MIDDGINTLNVARSWTIGSSSLIDLSDLDLVKYFDCFQEKVLGALDHINASREKLRMEDSEGCESK